MNIRTERLKIAYAWLRKNKGLRSQKELADKIGVDQNTISRAMTDKIPASDDVLAMINECYGNPFNYQWMRGESDEQFSMETKIPKPDHNADFGRMSISNLYAQLIKEVEELRCDLTEELSEIRILRSQLTEDRDALRTIANQLKDALYNRVSNHPFMVADSDDSEQNNN